MRAPTRAVPSRTGDASERGLGRVLMSSVRGVGRLGRYLRARPLQILAVGALDLLAPKDRKTVTIICKRRFGYCGNIRLVCEALAATGHYRVQLWCETKLPAETKRALADQHVHRLSRFSLRALWHLVSSGILVVDHSIRDAYIVRPSKRRVAINVWHGVPIKKIELCIEQLTPSRRRLIEKTASLYDAVIASSPTDRNAIARAFGIPPEKVHITGLPRYDLLTGAAPLAPDLAAAQKRLRQRLLGRRLVLYAPTFRERGPSPLAQLGPGDWRLLAGAVRSCGAVLGVRSHPYDPTECPTGLEEVIAVPAWEFPETNLVLREADALITDFSSIWVDYVLLDRPILGFARDRDEYVSRERGFIYRLNNVFPGTFCTEVSELVEHLTAVLTPGFAVRHVKQRDVFHVRTSSSCTDQCVRMIRELAERKLDASG